MQIPLEMWSTASDEDGLGFVAKLPPDVAALGHRDVLTESMVAYGAEIGIWRITDTLNRYNLPATGVFSGMAVEQHPDAARAFVAGIADREICAHSWAQDVRSYRLNREEMRANVRRCIDTWEQHLGLRPVGYVSPGGQFLEETAEILAEEGFIYHGDYADTDSAKVIDAGGRRIVTMSVPWEANDYSQYAHAYNPPSAFVEIFKRTFDVLYREGGQVVAAALHCMIYGRPFGVSAMEEIIEYALGQKDVWFTTRQQIAEVVLEQWKD
jgi:peptidoglycan/xylan/chitin deacetylase (PgdA/CDA1 family)